MRKVRGHYLETGSVLFRLSEYTEKQISEAELCSECGSRISA